MKLMPWRKKRPPDTLPWVPGTGHNVTRDDMMFRELVELVYLDVTSVPNRTLLSAHSIRGTIMSWDKNQLVLNTTGGKALLTLTKNIVHATSLERE